MAMTMSGEVQSPAAREAVWAKLNDPEMLKACIPGCESLDKTVDTEFQAVAVNKIGPVKARFKGKVKLTDLDPPNGYKISGEGDGGVAGFAKGGATVALTEKDGGTLLTYNVEAQIGGKLAQLGQRLVNGAAKKLADEFFDKFAARRGRDGSDSGRRPALTDCLRPDVQTCCYSKGPRPVKPHSFQARCSGRRVTTKLSALSREE